MRYWREIAIAVFVIILFFSAVKSMEANKEVKRIKTERDSIRLLLDSAKVRLLDIKETTDNVINVGEGTINIISTNNDRRKQELRKANAKINSYSEHPDTTLDRLNKGVYTTYPFDRRDTP